MKTLSTILLCLLANSLLAQKADKQDIALLNQAFEATPKVRLAQQYSLSKENSNELQAVLSGLFLVYKSFFSSQDNQRCSFHPSCSEFGLEAVKKFGIVRGIICTCDRLTRCNGFSQEQYEIDFDRRVLKDPVGW
jgi:putative component of membrane protein insertase Oxa1/YidC/SpoIIIJ protein YidD